MLKWIPRYKCSCGKTQWNFDDNVSSFKCRFCKHKIEKVLHNLEGAIVNKNDEGMYVLKFPEYKEISYYSSWEALQSAMNEASGENDKNNIR